MVSLDWSDAPEIRLVSVIPHESTIDVEDHVGRVSLALERARLADARRRLPQNLPLAPLRFPFFEGPAVSTRGSNDGRSTF